MKLKIEDGDKEPDDSGENAGLEPEQIEAETSKLDEEALNNFEPPEEKPQPLAPRPWLFSC